MRVQFPRVFPQRAAGRIDVPAVAKGGDGQIEVHVFHRIVAAQHVVPCDVHGIPGPVQPHQIPRMSDAARQILLGRPADHFHLQPGQLRQQTKGIRVAGAVALSALKEAEGAVHILPFRRVRAVTAHIVVHGQLCLQGRHVRADDLLHDLHGPPRHAPLLFGQLLRRAPFYRQQHPDAGLEGHPHPRRVAVVAEGLQIVAVPLRHIVDLIRGDLQRFQRHRTVARADHPADHRDEIVPGANRRRRLRLICVRLGRSEGFPRSDSRGPRRGPGCRLGTGSRLRGRGGRRKGRPRARAPLRDFRPHQQHQTHLQGQRQRQRRSQPHSRPQPLPAPSAPPVAVHVRRHPAAPVPVASAQVLLSPVFE